MVHYNCYKFRVSMRKSSIITGSISNGIIHWLYMHQLAQVLVRFVPVMAKFHNYNVLYLGLKPTLLPQYILWLSLTWLLAYTELYLVNCVIKFNYVLDNAVHIFNMTCVICKSANFYLYSGSFAPLPKIFVVKFSSVEPY